ncbi:MAG: hypothetical protein WEA09_13400 [Gemmatimonadota bacterium]
MNWLILLGGLAALFGVVLLVFPSVRVSQGRLTARGAVGLWLAGTGFLLIALAALVLSGSLANGAVLIGAALAILGNLLQRRAPPPPVHGPQGASPSGEPKR